MCSVAAHYRLLCLLSLMLLSPLAQAAGPGSVGTSAPGAARAAPMQVGGSAGTSVPGTPWAKEDVQDCGQSCIYSKGNENISLQATYIWRKIEQLKAYSGSDVLDVLGRFCRQGEGGDDCKKRYVDTMTLAMYRMQGAISRNEDSSAKLVNRKGGALGKEENAPAVEPGERKKGLKPQVPYVTTLKDIEQIHEQDPELLALAKDDRPANDKWAADIGGEYLFNPEDFAELKQVPRDLQQPKQGSVTVVNRDAKGKALKSKNAGTAKGAQEYQKLHQEVMKQWAAVKGKESSAKGKQLPLISDAELEAFREARALMIDTSNQAVKSLPTRRAGPTLAKGKKGKDDKKGAVDQLASAKPAAVKTDLKADPYQSSAKQGSSAAGRNLANAQDPAADQAQDQNPPQPPVTVTRPGYGMNPKKNNRTGVVHTDEDKRNVDPVGSSPNTDEFVTVSWQPKDLIELTNDLR